MFHLFHSSVYPNENTFPMRKDYCFTLRKIARICKDPLRQKVFVQKNGFGNFGISCNEILFYNNTSCKVVTLIFYLNALNFPPASEVYWQVANLNERKKKHPPIYGFKEFVWLSVTNFDPNYLRTRRAQ